MIYMSINTHDYENDVRVMIQAFYPREKITVDALFAADCRLRTYVCADGAHVHGRIEYGATADAAPESDTTADTAPESDATAESVLESGAAVTEFDFDAGTFVREAVRNRLKRELYGVYSKLTGRTLLWGTLTGIRPTKIPYAMIEKGVPDSEITENLQKEYLMSGDRAKLSVEVAHREHKLLSGFDYENGFSLYVGIPFCPTTCLYCSFTSYPISVWHDRVDEYLDALEKELCFLGRILDGSKTDTVYIGGGTPTTLSPKQLDRLICSIGDNFDLSGVREFTVEAGRPDSIDRNKLDTLFRRGVSRISVNPQTMNQKTLDLIGRKHTVEQVVKAFETARDCGFDNINMDLIAGLPGEGMDDVRHTLEEVEKLAPDSLTVHSLAIKRAAALNTGGDRYSAYRIENTDEIMRLAHSTAAGMGLLPYYLYRQKNMAGSLENVGFAKPQKESLYNILIMEEKQSIWAAGANSQSKIIKKSPARVDRIENVKDVADYIGRIDEMIERKRRYIDADGNK